MRGVVVHAPGDVRIIEREEPRIIDHTDTVIRVVAACVCGSDLWPYRGIDDVCDQVMAHEYVGIVEETGDDVTTVKPGDFVVGSIVISDGTCEICRSGYPSHCVNGEFVAQTIGTQAEKARIPYAHGTLSPHPASPIPS